MVTAIGILAALLILAVARLVKASLANRSLAIMLHEERDKHEMRERAHKATLAQLRQAKAQVPAPKPKKPRKKPEPKPKLSVWDRIKKPEL